MIVSRTHAALASIVAVLLGTAGSLSIPAQPAAAEPSPPLPTTFEWKSSGILVSPQADAAHPVVSVKDPTVVRFNNRWYVYATTANTAGNWSLVHFNFAEWSEAASAPQYHIDRNPAIGSGYRAAPQLFYFAPKRKWYLVYQTGLPSFSTADDPGRPETWTAPRNFQETMPAIVRDNIGNGFWLDYWVICDKVNCYLFSSDDNGHLYRARTTVAEFPNGFRDTVIVMRDPDRFRLFEGASVYRIKDTNTYLLLVEAIGTDGRRYYRSWTAEGIDGEWTPLADSEAEPFARSNNVAFGPRIPTWTHDISHGELIRAGIDQTMTIRPCNLRLLYQGMDPSAGGDYSQLPWRLGLLRQTNSPC
ncbi:non-reducing end alpha-L-arabinofuranosidase family hydrolase [Phytohabitans sp. LJ34]|uniref:non-reducing end alpha-L-arabinofuranosidase family hydrolase n=1 Tax=Phytohabitans sp. LJ34 TaxID=3452217 RepID=UPI003F8CBA84